MCPCELDIDLRVCVRVSKFVFRFELLIKAVIPIDVHLCLFSRHMPWRLSRFTVVFMNPQFFVYARFRLDTLLQNFASGRMVLLYWLEKHHLGSTLLTSDFLINYKLLGTDLERSQYYDTDEPVIIYTLPSVFNSMV